MAKEGPEGGAKSEKREGELSHGLVNRVLSTISEIEQKEEKETSQAKTSLEAEDEVPKEAKHHLRKKINFLVKVFSVLLVLSFGGLFLVAKSVPLKTWLAERFSILTHKIIREKDAIWIRRRVPGALRKNEFSALEEKIRKDVKGIPVDIGARRLRIYSQDEVSTLNFVTSEPMDRVVDFYKREMERREYGLVRDDYWSGANIAQLLFSKAGKECTISLVENETGGVSVAISYTE